MELVYALAALVVLALLFYATTRSRTTARWAPWALAAVLAVLGAALFPPELDRARYGWPAFAPAYLASMLWLSGLLALEAALIARLLSRRSASLPYFVGAFVALTATSWLATSLLAIVVDPRS